MSTTALYYTVYEPMFSYRQGSRIYSFVHTGLTTAYFPVTCSVPQRSVFGPLGFIAYTDDLTAVSERHNVHSHMYADDTRLYDSSPLVDAESV